MSTKSVSGATMNRRSAFPEGTYRGTITESADAQNEGGTFGSLAFQLKDNTAIDAEKEPGARPHFVRIPTWMEVENEKGQKINLTTAEVDVEDEEQPFALRNAVVQFAQLAAAVGAADVQEDGSVEFHDDLETFIEACRNQTYDGQEIDFKVSHRPEKKNGKLVKGGRTFVETAFLMPEASANGGEPEAAQETEEVEETKEEEVEEKPAVRAPAGRPSVLKGAQARQVTAKPSGALKGSGKPKFTRKPARR